MIFATLLVARVETQINVTVAFVNVRTSEREKKAFFSLAKKGFF